jgi:putative transcriptional regulator
MCNIGEKMIRCHLSRIMGEHKMKIADVSRATGLNRSTVTALYDEKASRIDLETIEKICRLFDCKISDLLEIVDN